MAKELQIRKAQKSDLAAIHQLVRELAVYEKLESEFIAPLEEYQQDFEAGLFECLLAERDSEILGMTFYYMAYSTWKGRMLWLEDFVVKETARGQGIGQLLFDAFLQEAKDRNCRLAKWQIIDWNSPAIKFYERQGATIEKNWWNGKVFFEE